MKVSRKMIESMAVAALAAALTITSLTTSGESAVEREDTVKLAPNGIAGVTAAFNEYRLDAPEELNMAVGVDQEIAGVVTASVKRPADDTGVESELEDLTMLYTEDSEVYEAEDPDADTIEDEVTLTPEEEEWQDKLMADVKDFLYIRAEASKDAKAVGKLYKGDRALIKEKGSEWTKIASGNVTGYVSNEYCLFGLDALAYAKEICDIMAQATTNGLRVRREPGLDAKIAMTLVTGDKLMVDREADAVDGWVAVKVDSKTCYVSADYVKLVLNTGKAVSMEEEAKKAAASKTSNQKPSSGMTQGASVAATADEETLLAALIDCEVGACSKECMIAVGAVVVNRVNSRLYPNDVHSVIYQRRQFGPASSGRLARRLETGPSTAARQAAKAALSGQDPTGGAKYFKLASSGHSGVVIGPVVFY